jgi:hypothetical protein
VVSDYGTFAQIPTELLLHEEISNHAKLLYAHLWDFASRRTRSAFPSRKVLAQRMKISVASTDRAIRELVLIGAVKKESRRRPDGSQSSNTYRLLVMRGGVSGDEGGVITTDTPKNQNQNEPEPGSKNSPAEREFSDAALDLIFDDLWQWWPKKADRKGARKKFDQLVVRKGEWFEKPGALGKVISKFGEAYRATTDVKFVPHLTTWLNREGWNDDLPSLTANEPWNAPPKNMSAAERRRATLHDAIAQAEVLDAQRAAQNLSSGELDR